MSDKPLTANDVALQLSRLARQLDELVGHIDGAERHAVTAREAYTMAYANAYLRSEGSIEARKHLATVATHAERLAAEAAEQVVKGIRRQIDSVKLRVDVGRSLGAALRAEAGLAVSGYGS